MERINTERHTLQINLFTPANGDLGNLSVAEVKCNYSGDEGMTKENWQTVLSAAVVAIREMSKRMDADPESAVSDEEKLYATILEWPQVKTWAFPLV